MLSNRGRGQTRPAEGKEERGTPDEQRETAATMENETVRLCNMQCNC